MTPVSELQRSADKIVKALRKGHRPVVITARGKTQAVLENVDDYQARLERLHLLESILRGLAAVEKGETVSHEAAMKELEDLLDG